MDKKISKEMIFFISIIILLSPFSGCLKFEKESENIIDPIILDKKLDEPLVLPYCQDGEYHDYYGTMDLLNEFQINYPDLVNVFSIGKSVLGKDIWCIRITNEDNNSYKYSCLIDGTIHGYEWEAGEACLYLCEYLLINYGKNDTISKILNTTKVYIIPILNPDGRQVNIRFNENGVDLNRNFDVYFGKIKGHCLRLGKIFGFIKIPVIKFPKDDPFKWYWNCGRYAFSEPETQSLKKLMKELHFNDFSFYVNCHTALHAIVTPWLSYKPPFEMTTKEKNLYEQIVLWAEKNTEYTAFISEGFETGGNAMDWCYKEFRIPSFTFELYAEEYDPCLGSGKHVDLVYWMKTTLPFFMYLLVNIESLYNWEIPNSEPSLPEGVPPPVS